MSDQHGYVTCYTCGASWHRSRNPEGDHHCEPMVIPDFTAYMVDHTATPIHSHNMCDTYICLCRCDMCARTCAHMQPKGF